mgnify:CR=1 FL=1|jgi:hypothetical protein
MGNVQDFFFCWGTNEKSKDVNVLYIDIQELLQKNTRSSKIDPETYYMFT